jgi:hypothetical protein
MIRHLSLKDVGPAHDLKFAFSPRLNVLTGDNGLGKTFVLDVLWWVLTTTWAGEKAFPFRAPDAADDERASTGPGLGRGDGYGYGAGFGDGSGAGGPTAPDLDPGIEAVLSRRADASPEDVEVVTRGAWSWESQEWVRPIAQSRRSAGSAPGPMRRDEAELRPESLVIYARIDGSYALFDAYFSKGGVASFADTSILLSPSEVWNGKPSRDPELRDGNEINGLIADWVSWQQRGSREFDALRNVLRALSPPDEPLVPSQPTRVHLRDRRDIPTLLTPYGVVPVTLASAGMKRALSLAYLLVWAWFEHEKAARTSRRRPTRDVVLLVDEPELHQHPAWQRAFLPAVLEAMALIAPSAGVQVVTATHSPLVLASLEPHFDAAKDSLFVFDLMPRARRVKVENVPWRPRGDVSNWLTSEVFDLTHARSREAEAALVKAIRVLDRPDLSDAEARAIHHDLHVALRDTDPFWARWLAYAQAKGIEP